MVPSPTEKGTLGYPSSSVGQFDLLLVKYSIIPMFAAES